MSTAVAEKPSTNDQALVAQKGNTVLFLARRSELRLIKVPRYDRHGAGGRKIGEDPGEAINFKGGQFICPIEGTIKLEDGRDAPAGEILEWLESHPRLGDFEGGFWRVDPTAPDVSQEELEALMDAVLNVDEDRIRQMIVAERQAWNREKLIGVAEKSLERIEEQRAFIVAQDAAAAQELAQAPVAPVAPAAAPQPPSAPQVAQEPAAAADAPLASADPPHIEE